MTDAMERKAEKIILTMSTNFGYTPEDLKGKSRKAPLIRARAQIMKRLRAEGFMLSDIGNLFDRHHATIIHHLPKEQTVDELVIEANAVLSKISERRDYLITQVSRLERSMEALKSISDDT